MSCPFQKNKKNKFMSRQPTYQKIFALVLTLFLILSLSNIGLAQNIQQTFELLDSPDGSETYQLTISVTQNLYEYYLARDHQLYNVNDLSRFVTPNPLEPVANDLWSKYAKEEDFVNGVLMITHQISYKETLPQKYPIETIRENEGDCDLFSFLAASIIKAGGIEVVLLLYEEEEHMAVGVNLQQEPLDARSNVYYYTYQQKRYYVAESTGNFEGGWRVGECPDLINGAQAQIIPLDNTETTAPGVISSSYNILQYSSLVLSVSPTLAISVNDVQIMGLLYPALEGRNITLYASSYGSSLTRLATVLTDNNGRYSYTWQSPPGGIYSIRASWSGDANYAGADSGISRLVIMPFLWLIMGAILFVCFIALLILHLAIRGNVAQKVEAQEDWDSLNINKSNLLGNSL
jgi:hypothetical protein